MQVTGGSTDVTTYFVLRLAADGTEATSLTITNFDLQYTRSGATPAAKVDATALGAANSAHADNQAIEIDATDQPGLYRVDWPDAAFAAGVREVILTVKCATCFTEHLRVQIDAPVNVTSLNAGQQSLLDLKDFADDGYDPSTNKVQGLVLADTVTNLTNAPTNGDLTATMKTSVTTAATAATPIAASVTGNVGGNVTGSVGSVATGGITAASFAANAITAAKLDPDVTTELQSGLATATKLRKYIQLLARNDAAIETDNSTELGEINADGGSGEGTYDLVVDSLQANRVNIGTQGAGLNAIVWNAAWDAEVQSECADALTAFGASTLTQANVRTAVGLGSANLDTQLTAIFADTDSLDTTKITTARAAVLTDWIDGGRLDLIIDAINARWTTALTESYSADGAAPTPAQLLFAVLQILTEMSVSGTTATIRKLDGSTTAFTLTLNSSSSPTSITRAT